MAIQFGGGNSFPDLGLRVHTTIYENAGDQATRKLTKPGLSSTTYARRHCVISGGFNVTYPNDSYPMEKGSDIVNDLGICIWPTVELKNIQEFTIIATNDNSAYHCFVPLDNKQIQHSVETLTKNTNYIAKQGSVYCTNADYKLNGITQKAGTLIVCSTQDATIIPQSDGVIAKFTAVSVEDTSLLNLTD